MLREMDLDLTQHSFTFTRGWFRARNLPAFREHIYPRFVGKPTVYLEIGLYEGMSASWMMQKVLTHPDSRAVGIDPWLQTHKRSEQDMEEVRARAYHNLKPWIDQKAGQFPKCQLIRATSADALRIMCHRKGRWGIGLDSVDLCMIDGQHSDLGSLDDARHVIQLVRVGGWILWDDVYNDRKKQENHVALGLKLWLAEVGDRVNPIWSSRYMEAFERIK